MPRCARAATRRCFDGIEDCANAEGHGMLDVWMSHGDKVDDAAAGLHADGVAPTRARSPAMADEARRFYGVQFHPEVTHTLQGAAILARFVRDICGCGHDWNMRDYVDEADRARSARRSAATRCCSACRAASIRRSPRR